MKKSMFVLVVLTVWGAALYAQTGAASAADFETAAQGNGVVITAYKGKGGAVAIPAAIGGKAVVGIGDDAFWGCSSLTSVTIPNSVVTIGVDAFGESSLTSVTIPNSVVTIGAGAFNYSSLKTVTIPNSVTSIGDEAFEGCTSLASVTIPNSVTSIGDEAFWGCSGLTSVTIPASVKSVGTGAFFGCAGLKPEVRTDIEKRFGINIAWAAGEERFMKAGEYYNSGDYAGAITAYSEAITRGSTNLDAYWFRGFAYIQTKHYDAAIADFDTVINRNPTFAVGYIARGDAYGAKGAYLSAIADYKTGLEKGYDPSGFSVDKSSKADMWFCGAMFIEITVNRFLGKSDVVAKYEGWLKTAGDKNKVTRAEVETFYRQNIGGLISTAVDEEFNKISFLLENSKTNPVRDHISVLTRDPKTGQYTLSYRGVYTNEKIRTIKGNTLEALSSEMRNGQYKSDFDETGIQAVRARAALIPAVVLSGAALSEAKNILVNFYTNPSQATYNALKDMNVVYRDTNINFGDIKYTYVEESCKSAFSALNHDLRQKIVRDSLQQTRYTVISKAQADRLVQLR